MAMALHLNIVLQIIVKSSPSSFSAKEVVLLVNFRSNLGNSLAVYIMFPRRPFVP